MKNISTLLLLGLSSLLSAQMQFSRADVLVDLDYLAQTLEDAHYDLYAYTPKEEFLAHLEAVKAGVVQESYDLRQCTNIFQSLCSKANNGHTEIPFPGQAYGEYLYGGGSLFPLELAFEEGKALVRRNCSTEPSIAQGAEILSINGQSIETVLEGIYPIVSAERRYFKLAKIELISFPRLYWQAYGEQKEFKIEIRDGEVLSEYTLPAARGIEDFEMRRNEVFYPKLELDFYDAVAYLRSGNFHGPIEAYQKSVDSAFEAIGDSPYLIIDLRNNLGGDDAHSSYLVSYIADQKYTWTNFRLKSSATLKKAVRSAWPDTTSAYAKGILGQKNGKQYAHAFEHLDPQPEAQRYKGKVFVMVNRQSHSMATVCAAQIQDYGWATVVGEETGEYAHNLYASQLGFVLPKTGIEAKTSKGFMQRLKGGDSEKGIKPDVLVRDHLLDEVDEVLLKTLSLIEEEEALKK